jgi:hypothetical protein
MELLKKFVSPVIIHTHIDIQETVVARSVSKKA